jgi:hypothetical protein
MNLLNFTQMQAGYTMGTQLDGRELLTVAVKGTFQIPENPEREPELAKEQAELVHTDVFTGEPPFSAPVYENDYAPRKPRCDVLLNGSAYAPGGKPVERVSVSLRVGTMTKSFEVVGNRVWKAGILYMTSTKPKPFTVMPISYDNAFGGVDKSQEDEAKFRWYPTNFAGVGYHEFTAAKFLDGKPLPNTEERGQPITNPRGNYRPMAFGPIGRAWQPRPKLAGTYDQKWLDEKFPFLPDDFKDKYFQSSPPDQQIDHAKGGEEVELINLTPEGKTRFRLPGLVFPVLFSSRAGKTTVEPVVDTVVIEPDKKRFMMTWRATLALRRNIHEMDHVQVGRPPRDRNGTQTNGKRKFGSLEELAAWKKQTGGSVR